MPHVPLQKPGLLLEEVVAQRLSGQLRLVVYPRWKVADTAVWNLKECLHRIDGADKVWEGRARSALGGRERAAGE